MFCLAVVAALFPLCVSSLTPASTNIYIHAPGKMLPGPFTKGSVKVARNLTLGECAAECSLEYLLNQFPCYAYEYASRERTCLMTNITTLVAKGGYLGLRSNSAMDYYERPKGSYENLFQPYPNQVLERDETYFAVFRNKTLEKCALFCLMETRKPCMSFSYSENKQACGLSSVYYTADNGQTLQHSTEYNHYQYYTTWPCNATIPWNYSPRAIASPYFPYASITDVNCHVIIEASEGKQVDLQFSTFYTKGSLCGGNGGISVYDGSTNSAPLMSTLCSSDNFVDRRYQSSTGYLYVQFSTGSVPMAFKGVYDFIEVDMCKMAPCQNGGSCISTSGTYYCDCAAGYTGSKCEANIDECASNPCYLGGQCIDRVNGFECKCPDLLGGPRCNVFVGLCHMKPCQNGATCSPRGTSSYVCTCPDGFTGQNCTTRITDPCDIRPCKNGAQCLSNTDRKSFECQCLAGFTGSSCETDIDECASSPCLHHFKCHDLVNDYRCDCPPILGGKKCELFLGGCSVRPCVHGQCRPAGATSYTCQCEDGYKGDNCSESFIDFCDPDPCDHGACASTEKGPSCTCDLGYTGFLCDTKIDYCDGVDCHQGECVGLEDDFQCTCLPGYEGRLCNMTINHCKTASCNGGFCINTLTSHFCVCKGGHTGTTCETTPTDECSKTCVNGTCVLRDNTAHCVCDDDFTGTSCDVPIDYCIASPCSHGQCDSVPGGYSCTCDENYTGTNCDDVIDYCFENKCVFGFCQGMENGYRCLCGQGFHGDYCDLREGETTPSTTLTALIANATTQTSHGHPRCSHANCRFGVCDRDFISVCVCYVGYKGGGCEEFVGCTEHNPCNHGNCSDVNDGYECLCEEGYSGKNCEIDVTDPNPCASISCQNGGMCYSFNQSDSSMGYECFCFPGNHGRHCEFTNACLRDVCKNDTCVPIGNGFRCEMTVLSGSSQFPTSTQLVTGGIWSSGRLFVI